MSIKLLTTSWHGVAAKLNAHPASMPFRASAGGPQTARGPTRNRKRDPSPAVSTAERARPVPPSTRVPLSDHRRTLSDRPHSGRMHLNAHLIQPERQRRDRTPHPDLPPGLNRALVGDGC